MHQRIMESANSLSLEVGKCMIWPFGSFLGVRVLRIICILSSGKKSVVGAATGRGGFLGNPAAAAKAAANFSRRGESVGMVRLLQRLHGSL